jgi:hypothetical protein
MSKTRRTKGRNYEGYYYYYFCLTRVNKGQDACPQLRGFRAEPLETKVWEFVRSLMLDPEHLLQRVASILICPQVDATSANQTSPSSRSRMCIMRCGSRSLKPAVAVVC